MIDEYGKIELFGKTLDLDNLESAYLHGDCPFMRWSGTATVCGRLNNEEIDPLSPDFDKFEAGEGMPDWRPLPGAPSEDQEGR